MSPTPTDLNHTPAASAPPGFTSNLIDPVRKEVLPGITLAIVGMVISTAFLAMRVYTKAFLARIFGLDDILLIISWAASLSVQITIVYYMADRTMGTHVWDISVQQLKNLVLVTSVDSVTYLIVLATAKIAILLFYLKLARERWFILATYAAMGVVVSYGIALACSLIFACTPLVRVWDVTVTEGHCINRGKIYLATAGLNATTDIVILILPMPMIYKLQVKRIQKLGLLFIFSIGSTTMVTSMIRLCLMPPLVKATDMSWAILKPAIWICIESNLIVICGSLPILRLFLQNVAPRLIGEYGSTAATGRPGRSAQKHEYASAELSNLERSKRSHRDQYSTMETVVGNDEGSDTFIGERADKAAIAVDITDLGDRDRDDSSLAKHAAPVPYSHGRSTPPPRPARSPPPPV
ncbi:hypothetical protein AC579_6149 [Lecanosticta acicola]|uniref:Rhodopsin domain-containing protein n=1 Tax=Lecanosticta acicola TaxID=111012 RepID=A0AAI9E769_9PEZI|nr:hypothetical protein AC579_6149 [Lecanosticta acicola]